MNEEGRGRPFEEPYPSIEETVKLGEELVEWAKLPTSLLFSQFYSEVKKIPRKRWKSIVQRHPFVDFYEKAQSMLSVRMMDLKCIEKSFGHRLLRLYCKDLVEEENETAEFKAKLKSVYPEEGEYIINVIDYDS